MAFFKLRLHKKLRGLSDGDQERFLSDSLNVFRFDPHMFLFFWIVSFFFCLFFFFTSYYLLAAAVAWLLVFHMVFSFVLFFLKFLSFFSRWF